MMANHFSVVNQYDEHSIKKVYLDVFKVSLEIIFRLLVFSFFKVECGSIILLLLEIEHD